MKNTKSLTPISDKQTETKAEVLKLGIDIHKREYVVVHQLDNQSPKSPQKFSPDAFLTWIAGQRDRAIRIVTCYEAGCFGYVLHRQLESMGIENFVVRPRNWDDYGSKVKTDARDARELCSHLDRFLAGNERALSVVRVPTEEQERSRSLSRQRDTLSKELKQLQNVGISNARYYGYELQMSWWKSCNFKQGSINKHGNPRIRHNLVEAVWRFLQFQPDYKPIKYWKQRMCNEPFGKAKKKKMTVAIARRFAVDWSPIAGSNVESKH